MIAVTFLGTGAYKPCRYRLADGDPFETSLFPLALSPSIRDVWERVRDVRNDTAHCGMNANPAGALSIIKRIDDLVGEVHDWIDPTC